ncbi:MAG: hypothetical protein JJT76_14595 [Clostridiaceae bacterium]|nr:hypothetical protein [Clostridiaceae bacterium]
MNKERYDELVQIVVDGPLHPPKKLVEDFYKWQSRLMLARFLANERYQQYTPALELMEYTLDKDMRNFDGKGSYEEYLDHKVSLLSDLGVLHWNLYKDGEKALKYLSESLELAESVDYEFSLSNRGDIWNKKLKVLEQLGDEEKVLEAVRKKFIEIERESTFDTNSYLYYGNLNLAQITQSRCDWKKAVENLKEALNYLELHDHERESVDELWEKRDEDYERTYREMEKFIDREVIWSI